MSASRAIRLTTSFQRCARSLVSADAPASTSGVSVAGGDVHFRAHRADRGDEIDHPADLGFGGGIAEIAGIERQQDRRKQPVVRARGRHQDRLFRRQRAGLARPFGQYQQAVALGRHRPQLLGDEGHERVQQFQNLVARPRHHGTRLGFRRALLAHQHGLGEFEIPVAIDVPDEPVDRGRRIVETIGFDRLGDLARRARGFMRDPAVQRLRQPGGVEIRRQRAAVHFGKAAGIPELGREIAVALDALRRRA